MRGRSVKDSLDCGIKRPSRGVLEIQDRECRKSSLEASQRSGDSGGQGPEGLEEMDSRILGFKEERGRERQRRRIRMRKKEERVSGAKEQCFHVPSSLIHMFVHSVKILL